jgi:hypothetical protein
MKAAAVAVALADNVAPRPNPVHAGAGLASSRQGSSARSLSPMSNPCGALAATLVYWLVSFWLLIPVGGGVWGALTRFASKSPRTLAVPTGYRGRAAARGI